MESVSACVRSASGETIGSTAATAGLHGNSFLSGGREKEKEEEADEGRKDIEQDRPTANNSSGSPVEREKGGSNSIQSSRVQSLDLV